MLRRPDIEALDEARRDADRLGRARCPTSRTASDAELLAWIESYPPRLGASMRRLLESSMVGAAPRGMLERLVEPRRRATPGLVNRLVTGTGDVDSAQPARRLWALGRLVAADPDLTAAFDAGLDGVEARVAGTALAGRHRCVPPRPRPPRQRRVRAGHAGVGDGPLTRLRDASIGSGTSPTTVIRRRPPSGDRPTRTRRSRRRSRRSRGRCAGLVRRAGTVARLGEIARERAKDILVLENLAARRVLHELVRRAPTRGGPEDPAAGVLRHLRRAPSLPGGPRPRSRR